jgi:hypothetical protein
MVSPHKIKFNQISSEELNVIDLIMCVAFDSDNGETSTFLGREAVASESYDGRYKNVTRYKYNELFSPRFTFMKKNFGNFTMEEVRQVLKWLTSLDTASLLNVYYDDSEVVSWSAVGGWTEINTYKLANNRTVGITAVFEAVTPYALSRLYTATKTITATDNKLTIDIDTDDNKPVYPKITIQEKGLVVNLPTNVSFNNINDMAGYVENTIYHNESDGYYYYKAFTPTFMQGPTLPDYVNWTTVEANRKYTNADIFATNTFYHYEYEDMYYWKKDGVFYEEPTRPVYGDWKTKDGTKVYTASDTFEEKTIYSYNNNYYWMAPYSFYKSNTLPSLTTTSVKIINQHYNFFNQPSTPVTMVVKNNTSTEKIVIDGANRIPWSTNTRRIFGSDFDWNWLPLYDGKNELTVEGNCTVTLEWREVRKVGEF